MRPRRVRDEPVEPDIGEIAELLDRAARNLAWAADDLKSAQRRFGDLQQFSTEVLKIAKRSAQRLQKSEQDLAEAHETIRKYEALLRRYGGAGS